MQSLPSLQINTGTKCILFFLTKNSQNIFLYQNGALTSVTLVLTGVLTAGQRLPAHLAADPSTRIAASRLFPAAPTAAR